MEETAIPDGLLRDTDGTRLLFYDEVAAKTGNMVSTIRAYNSEAARKRRKTHRASRFDFPAPRKTVQRVYTKADGQPVTVWTPVWREDRIDVWMANLRGPGGLPRKEKAE